MPKLLFIRTCHPLLWVLGLFVLLAPVRADDLLVNGDFSQGSSGWGGDNGSGDTSDNPYATSTSSGLVVNLNSDLATRLYQTFTARGSKLSFSLTCTPSTACKFTGAGKVSRIASDIDPETEFKSRSEGGSNTIRTSPNGNYPVYMSTFSGVTVIITDRDNDTVYVFPLRINPASAQSQTATVSIGLPANKDYKLYIAFPPGEGSINLTKVSLAKPAVAGTGSAPPPSPAGYPLQQ